MRSRTNSLHLLETTEPDCNVSVFLDTLAMGLASSMLASLCASPYRYDFASQAKVLH